jgi:ribosomal protein L7/L12
MLKTKFLNFSINNLKVLSRNINLLSNPKFYFTTENEKKFTDLLNSMKPIVERFTPENEEKNFNEIKGKLNEQQREKVELLAEKYASLNEYQLEYYTQLFSEYLVNQKKVTYIDLNTDWNKLIKLGDKAVPVNPGYFQQQEFMANFVSWLAKQPKADLGLGFTTTAATAAPTDKKVEKKEEKKEEKQEKAQYDLELTSFDSAKKIALIKEVRVYTNLGLKEAKELVEKAPTVIMKGVKKDDTEAIIKKLSESGAKITLK